MHLRRPNLGDSTGSNPVALSSRALCEKRPKTLRGHPLKPQTRPFNSEAHGLTMSYRPDIPPQIKTSKLCPAVPLRGITRPSTPPHVVAQRAPGCNRSSRSRAVLEGHHAFCFLEEAAASPEARLLGARGRLQKMQAEAPTCQCSCNGRSPTPKSELKT